MSSAGFCGSSSAQTDQSALSLKVHVALAVVLPTALVLVAGGGWLAAPAGVLTGAVLAIWLGRLAVARLADRQVSILHALAGAV